MHTEGHERHIAAPEELGPLAEDILKEAGDTNGAAVLALHGELGAGKTAFVQSLAALMGVAEHVTSPTFVVMKFYETKDERFSRLVHIDAYRIEEPRELAVLGIDEVLRDPSSLVCIEWAERVGELLPEGALHMTFTPRDDGSRTVAYGKG
jgi:tRNA threonylcarbamoyladenosine biosynthesis protein TsaE